jgi:hypothetical protein
VRGAPFHRIMHADTASSPWRQLRSHQVEHHEFHFADKFVQRPGKNGAGGRHVSAQTSQPIEHRTEASGFRAELIRFDRAIERRHAQ